VNAEDLARKITAKAGGVARPTFEELSPFEGFLVGDVGDYLRSCIPTGGCVCSGVRLLPMELLREENLDQRLPGNAIFDQGFLVFATTISGNALCEDRETSKVLLIGSAPFFGDGTIGYQEKRRGQWVEDVVTASHIRGAATEIGEDFGTFLTQLVDDELEAFLEEVD
jgi:hypothetical protein